MVRVLGLLLPRPPLTLLCRRTTTATTTPHRSIAILSSAFTPTRFPPPPSSSPLIPFRARCLAMAKVSEVGLTKTATPVVPEIAVSGADTAPAKWSGDLLVVGVFDGSAVVESGKFQNGELAALDELVGGLLSQIATEEDFSGKAGQSTFHRIAGCAFKRVGLVGLGKSEKADATSKVWRSLGESVATASKTAQANSAAVTILEGEKLSETVKHAAVTAITSGAVLGSFEDMRFKSEFKKPLLKTLHFLGFGAGLEALISQTVQQSAGVILAKQLVNAPPNVLLPSVLASEAEAIAEAHSDVMSIKILEKEECEKLGMGAYLGVSAASTNPPKFIHLQYNPSGGATTKLAIVGKGLTFDSGGYNLKTGPGCLIELMKFDMGGAAAVLGCAKAIAAIKPAGVEVHFIVAACENMISGGGMRPGDILTASNGKTIEVNNTDAEGRLTLADALVYASNLKVDKIVDLATLTGACIIALGNEIGGMFTPFDELAEELSASSKRGGEKLWRMPMEESYWEMMKSGIADMVNTGGRPGGSITAALFLKHYVDENIPWAHLDIAGPVWKDKTGGTGFAVATLVEWVVKHKASSS